MVTAAATPGEATPAATPAADTPVAATPGEATLAAVIRVVVTLEAVEAPTGDEGTHRMMKRFSS